MRKTLHSNVRLKRRPKYALLNLNKSQAAACIGASVSIVLLMLAAKIL